MVWGLITFVLGLLVGWANPGTRNRVERLKISGLLAGLVAFGYIMFGVALRSDPLLLGPGLVANLVTFLLLTVLFLIGAWAGDRIERRSGRVGRRGST